MKFFCRTDPLAKPLVFITGAPRSGTSLVTKVIDAHPDIAVLMENIFGNRRRHWVKADFWHSSKKLRKEVAKVYTNINQPIVGNKVITPDVWSEFDILMFCKLFKDFKIVFVVRDPIQVALSRFNREDFKSVYTTEAKENILLDFRSQFLTYTSSWRQNIEAYWKLKDGYPDKIFLLYYEDFCTNFENQSKDLCKFLGVSFSDNILNWHTFPHHNAHGDLIKNLKYEDNQVKLIKHNVDKIPEKLQEALASIQWQMNLWKERKL
jgi:hypothetical protein